MPFKEIRRIHRECPVCDDERDVAYGEITETLSVRGENVEVTSKIYYCPKGDHYFYDIADEEDKFQAAYREYKERKGLLQSGEIKAIRKQYGLSQKSLARLFGWGDITPHRYETGGIQDDAHNSLLLMIRDFEQFKAFFELRKRALEPHLVKEIEGKILQIETKRNSSTIELLVRLFAKGKKDRDLSFIKPALSEYRRQDKSDEYSANEELALAA